MQKYSIEDFAWSWEHGETLSPDLIEDETLKNMYVELLALGQDYEELAIRIERYIDANTGSRRYIYEAGNEDVDSEPDKRRPELTH